ncbi:HYR-like domain-containing protein, partial [Flavobacterium xinjiangense]
TAPTFTAPANLTIYTSATCTYDKTVTATGDVTNEADNCSTGLNATFTDAAPVAIAGCQGGFTIARTWSLVDNCGNATANQVQTITIRDNTAPTLTVPVNTTAECSSVPQAGIASAVDNCDTTPTVTFVGETSTKTSTGACTDQNYTLTRTWKAEDSCGNFVTKSQTIKVQDTTAPSIFTRPQDIILESDNNCYADTSTASTGIVTNIIDNCDPNPTATPTSDSDCFGNSDEHAINAGVGNYFPFTVSGFDGISASDIGKVALAFETNQGKGRAEFTLVAPNGQAVILIGPYCTGSLACDDSSSSTKELYTPVFYPNGHPMWNNNNLIPVGTGEFTPNGALSSTNSINPINGPVSYVSNFEDFTGDMNGNWFIYSRKQSENNGNVDFKSVCLTPSEGACGTNKLIVRHWSVSDVCKNTAKFDQVIRVIDKMAPTFTKPADKTIYTDANCQYNKTVEFTGDVSDEADNCSTGIQTTYADAEPVTLVGCQGGFTISRTWSLIDNCGNKAADQIQTITIRDDIAPTFTAPVDKTIYTDANCTYNTNIEFTGDVINESDNCSTAIQATYADAEPVALVGCQGGFTITRTWSLTDNCGNKAVDQIQTITIRDAIAPTFTAPADKTIYTDATCIYNTNIEFTGDVLDESDNCSTGIQATYADAEPVALVGCEGGFTIARTWSLTDNCGNKAVDQIQTITIRDNTAPNFTAPADKTIYASSTCTYDTNIEFTGDVSDETDNCSTGIQATYADAQPVAILGCQGGFTIARTWSLTDNCGNKADDKIQTITILDNTPPTFTIEALNITVECDGEGNQNSIGDWLANNGGAVASDTCSNVTWSNNFNSLSNDCSTAVTVIFTAKDSCGNTASTSATFSVQDSTKPIAPEAPASVTVSCSNNVPIMSSLSAIDNCSGQITTEGIDTIKQGNCTNSYVITRTWTFTDACSNSSSSVQTITVQDINAPVIAQLPAATTISCPALPEFTQATATDECGSAFELTHIDTTVNGACAGSYSVTRTWTAKD